MKRLYFIFLLACVFACGGGETKAPESELRELFYCNQDWGNSPYRVLNDGNPHCENPCASFSALEHHDGCNLVEPTVINGTMCAGIMSVAWEGWKGCCAPHTKDAAGNYAGIKFVACD